MNEKELYRLLEGATERPNLEFKGPMDWEPKSIAKDILAMANTKDGGFIIFGVEDQTLNPVGLSLEQFNSFDEERIRDQIENFADPHVEFSISKFDTSDQKQFVTISVQEFSESPVICKKHTNDTIVGAIYIRPKQGRAQSRPIKTSSEMRDLVERSVFKARAKFVSYGALVTEQGTQETLDEELGDLK